MLGQRIGRAFFSLAAALAVALPPAAADDKPAETPAEPCPICEARNKLNELIPGVKWGADLRLRAIYDNNLGLNGSAAGHERFWTRYRGRVWTSITPIEDLQFNIRLVAEPRLYCKPDEMEHQLIRHEAIFDQFNVQWTKPFELPLKLTVGRQDIKLGDGWLVIEGTPRDGTRTFFFDAIRATLDAAEIKTTFDVICLRNHANSSSFIRPFNDRDLDLIEHDETGVIVYASNKSLQETTLDGYFIYKHDDRQLAAGNNSDIYTVGARAAGRMDENWTYGAEVAPQWGQTNGVEKHALGFNGNATYHLNDKLDNSFKFAYEYRSGDKNRNGAFDMLWGRFPHWSNIVNDYVAGLEGLPSMLTNIHRLGVGWGCKPAEKLTLDAYYHLLFRDRNPLSNTAGFSNRGRLKGQLFSGLLGYKFNEHLSGHLIGEVFLPGNYYDSTRNDVALFLRYELVLRW